MNYKKHIFLFLFLFICLNTNPEITIHHTNNLWKKTNISGSSIIIDLKGMNAKPTKNLRVRFHFLSIKIVASKSTNDNKSVGH